ncbi:MAG: hypothetical protein AAF387_18635 [Pseudomonadota bacterium]
MTTHLFIPDSQVRDDEPTDQLEWIGRYIVDYKPDVIINAGDFADMPSLSHWDKGKKKSEGKRVAVDFRAARDAMNKLMHPLDAYNSTRRFRKEKQYKPDLHLTLGNHEDRVTRAIEGDAKLEGAFSIEDDLNYEAWGWRVYPFLEVVHIDGVAYSHYFANPMTGKPYGGLAATRLKTIGHSFTMGHVQTLDTAQRFLTNGQRQRALIAGAAYLHNEDYKGPQGNPHWRGIIVKHEVREGGYDLMEVSLDYLCRRYEGTTVKKFCREKYGFEYLGLGDSVEVAA